MRGGAYMWSHTSVREKVGLSMGEAYTRGGGLIGGEYGILINTLGSN